MKKIFIWWIQWVWKTTVSESIIKKNNTIWRFSFWEKLYEIAKSEIPNYEGIQFLSDNDRFRIIETAKKQLQEIITSKRYEKSIIW